jgi:hypothetical protein
MHACSRLFCLAILLSLTAMPLCAQTISFPYGEIGGQLGGMYYLGDINNVPFKGTRPAIAAFYRHNFNVRYSAKALLSYGKLTASDSKYKSEFQKARDYSFNRGLVHFSVLGEFNFLPFIFGKKDMPFATYLQGGMGMGLFPGDAPTDKFIVDVPFGFGVKFNSHRKFVYGVDWMMIKTFTDNIDFKAPRPSEVNGIKQKYVASNNDWLSYFSIYLAYKIEYPKKCPTFD